MECNYYEKSRLNYSLSAPRVEFYDASAMAPPVCILCEHTLARSENRRKLHSPASKHIFPLLSGLVEEMYPHAVETIIHPKSFVCRPCLRGLKKLRTLSFASSVTH